MGDVTAVMMDVITEKSGHQVVPMAVSVCITPAAPSPLPIPYPVIGNSSEGITDPPMRTKINGAPIATVGSCIKTCHGNEPGTLKEVVSLNTTGPCFLIMGAPVVLCELGMMGITTSPCISNKAITVGAPANASDAGGTGGAGGGGGGGGGPGGDASGSQGPSGGGGSDGSDTHTGASGPGSSSGPADAQQCQGGHPVNLVSGTVVEAAVDIELPGAFPFVFRRSYSSARRADKGASLGPGWAHGFEQRITVRERTIVLREGEGRTVHFARIAPGESTFHRRERLTLHCDGEDTYRVWSLDRRRTYTFSAARAGGPALLRSIRDAWDNTIALEHEGERLVRLVDTAGREVDVEWKSGRIRRLSVTVGGSLEQWIDYEYSAAGDLTSVSDALGYKETYEYDRFHRMVGTVTRTGVEFRYEYEENTGRCKRTWGPKGLYALELAFDADARVTHVEGEEPRVIHWNDEGMALREATPDGVVLEEKAYDEDGFLIAASNGAGEGVQIWYDARGNRVRVVDAAGGVTAFDNADDLVTRETSPDGRVTEYTYDTKGAVTSYARADGTAQWFAYDDRGRLTAVRDARGILRSFEYDGAHNLVAETDAMGARTAYAYDGMGRVVSRTDALGRVMRVTYDRLGRRTSLSAPAGTTMQWAHDAQGNVVRETDATGKTTHYEYSGMGVLTRLTTADRRTWTLAYTSKERLREIKNPRGESYRFTYDTAGRTVLEQTFDGRELAYEWHASGRLAKVVYPDGGSRSYRYDRLGFLLGEETGDGVMSVRRDRRGRPLEAVLDQDGEQVTLRFERDASGRVVAEAQGDFVIRYGYDALGRVVTRTLPDGTTTQYAYDARGEASRVEHAGHALVFERDLAGRETSRADERGAVTVKSVWDHADRLVEQRVVAPAIDGVPQIPVQRQWRYDAVGRVTRIDDSRWGASAYRYDVTGLLAVERGAHKEAFAYDAAGALVDALVGLEGDAASSASWEIAPGNRLKRTARTKYTYDARGRRTVALALGGAAGGEGKATEYRWDGFDRLREVALPDGRRVRFTYDAFGRRVRKEVHASEGGAPRVVKYLWDQNALVAEIDSERGSRSFVHKPGTLSPLLQAERGEVLTYVNDHLGTPKELIDQAGRVAWAAAHTAWGKVVDATSDTTRRNRVDSPFRLLGQVADDEIDLACTRYRWFDPAVGRWLSPDPLGPFGGADLFGFNGCPTTDVDPLGLAPIHAMGPFPPGSTIVEDKSPSHVRYTDASGQERIRFRAQDAVTAGQATPGRNYSGEARAGVNDQGQPYVFEGRHRAVGAAKGDTIPPDVGGVPGAPGHLDYPYDPSPVSGGVPVKNLSIDYTEPDVDKATARQMRINRYGVS